MKKKIIAHALLKIAETTLKNHISPIEKPHIKPTVCKQIVSKLCVKKITSAYVKILDPCRKYLSKTVIIKTLCTNACI